MAIFSPRTFPEIMKDMLARLISATPLTDVNYGSVWTTMLEAAAQEDDEQYFQMLEITRGYSLDQTTGTDLDNRATEYGLDRLEAAQATTVVTISDTAITKVSTGVYSGLSGSPAGANYVNGNDATGFLPAGSIIIGRGTPNVEAIAYSSIDVFANYVKFNLSSNLANDHGTDETIIMSQGGDRLTPGGSVVKVPASDLLELVTFSLDVDAIVLDGESEVTDVAVTALETGTKSNVPIGAISVFESLPFPTATVRNPYRVTNGLDEESDQELRDRIKATIQSLSRGTRQAITTGVLGLVSEVDNKRVVSVSLRDTTNPAEVVKLFIDDGTGFIPDFLRVGYEEVVASATGGEKFLQTVSFPLVKASTETQNAEPYNIPNNGTLFVEVNGISEAITFVDSDFAAPGSATAQEVLKVINAEATLFESRVSSGGTKVRIFARASTGEEIRVTGGTANTALNFQTDIKYTSKLYRLRENELSLLSKDGRTAAIESGSTATWDFSGSPVHLSVVVDGKFHNILKIWLRSVDFITPTAVNVLELAEVITSKLPGAICEPSSNDTRVNISSNTTRSISSKIRVVSDFDYCLNEESGANVDRKAEFQTDSSNVTVFGAFNDYMYLGHEEIPFDSVFVKLASISSDDILPVFEYWNGSAWTEIGVRDDTEGFTQDGHILYAAPYDWAKTLVEGNNAYWLRVQRTQLAVTTPPVESRIRICGANEMLQFSETEAVGSNNDYAMNRFVGQIELIDDTLRPGDQVTLGSFMTRAFAVTQSAANYSGLAGLTLDFTVDGVAKSITFQLSDFVDPGAITATEVATAMNARVDGITASTVDSASKVRVQTDTINDGSIQFTDTGANTVLSFPSDLREGFISHQPGMESLAGPYTFAQDDYILVVIDDAIADTFTVPCYKASELTGVTNLTTLVDTALLATFPDDDQVAGYDLLITDGPQAGVRRSIDSYVAVTGTIVLSSAMPGLPDVGDPYQIIPVTAKDVEDFWNNKQVTLLKTKAEIRLSSGGTKVQIGSLTLGEDAAVSVTGGPGNTQLGFPLEVRGVDGYRYFTGLAQQVQWTVDGRSDNQDDYPGLRAAGVQVEVIEPVTIPIAIEVAITTTEGVTLSSISNDIKSAITNYINRLEVSADVIVSEITVAVKNVSGVFDAEIILPSANIAIADNEQARIAEEDITVG
jgi:uncharacterized phage protein gp47/JayE